MEDKTRGIVNHGILLGILLFLGAFMPILISLGAKGFEDPAILSKFSFYAIEIALFGAPIFILYLISTYYKKDDRYGNSLFFASGGEFPAFQISIFKRPLMLFFISVIFFSFLLGLAPKFTGQTYFIADVPLIKEQFTPTQGIWFSNLLVPIAENLGFALAIAVIILVLRYYVSKYNVSTTSYRFMSMALVSIGFTIFAVIMHLTRYSDSDIAILTVAAFWTIGGIITAVTGSFIPLWIMHLMNNLFIDLNTTYQGNITLIVAGSMIVISSFFIILMQLGRKNKI
jgi:hypothetical protein